MDGNKSKSYAKYNLTKRKLMSHKKLFKRDISFKDPTKETTGQMQNTDSGVN